MFSTRMEGKECRSALLYPMLLLNFSFSIFSINLVLLFSQVLFVLIVCPILIACLLMQLDLNTCSADMVWCKALVVLI